MTSISPALLEELTNEISTLASVYHKPVEAFIGRGRLGADELARKGQIAHGNGGLISDADGDDVQGAKAAIQVVAQGQRSENLLDFGADDEGDQNSMGTPMQVAQIQNGRSVMSSVSTKSSANPLDDLLGLFDSAGLGPGSSATPSNTTPSQNSSMGMLGINGFGVTKPNTSSSPAPHPPPQQSSQPKQSDMDLMNDLF